MICFVLIEFAWIGHSIDWSVDWLIDQPIGLLIELRGDGGANGAEVSIGPYIRKEWEVSGICYLLELYYSCSILAEVFLESFTRHVLFQ